MRLMVPTIGTVLTLTEDWTFTLHEEYRNYKFSKAFRLGFDEWGDYNSPKSAQITLPAGTKLKVARIYIRNGGADMKEFDSLTFNCNSHLSAAQARKQGAVKGRFWAKLIDVNSMEVAFDGATMPIPEYRQVASG